MADIDKLKQIPTFIDELSDVVGVLMADDKVSLKDLLNKDLYSEALDLVPWKNFFESNWQEMVDEVKDLDTMEAVELCQLLMEAIKNMHSQLG